jgi:hypothetical protein
MQLRLKRYASLPQATIEDTIETVQLFQTQTTLTDSRKPIGKPRRATPVI